jgi:hypothetical protein
LISIKSQLENKRDHRKEGIQNSICVTKAESKKYSNFIIEYFERKKMKKEKKSIKHNHQSSTCHPN